MEIWQESRKKISRITPTSCGNGYSTKCEEVQMKTHYLTLGLLTFFLALMVMQVVIAADFNQPISAQDKATFDSILLPIMKIYNLVKYAATVLAVVTMLFAGITYMTSGADPGKREKAKSMAMYVIVGLIVIWAAPLVVNFIIS